MNTSAGSCFLFGTDFVPLLLFDASSVLLSLASHTIIIALGYSWQQADLLTEYCPFRPNYSASFSTWLHPMRKEVHKRASWLKSPGSVSMARWLHSTDVLKILNCLPYPFGLFLSRNCTACCHGNKNTRFSLTLINMLETGWLKTLFLFLGDFEFIKSFEDEEMFYYSLRFFGWEDESWEDDSDDFYRYYNNNRVNDEKQCFPY